ncbi:MAG: glutamate racemase [Candidatus Omnitrophica bacterium]|nr:glutamate racemase [Candidatus Omnitrophota bacterium]
MDKRPIGIFDSGVGGLTVLKKLSELLPEEDIIYFGDTARVPYGNKSQETVTRFAKECIQFLKKLNIKLLVIACNTASSWSLDALRKNFSFPIKGVIAPAVKEACQKSKNSKIGVIGTNATVKSRSYIKALGKNSRSVQVFQQACPLFVPLVEEGWFNGKTTIDVARTYLSGLKNKNIDTLILGCTHYPLLKGVFKKVFGRKVKIIDSSMSVSCEIKNFLENNSLRNTRRKGRLKFFVTDEVESFKRISKIFLKKNINVKRVNL